MPRGVRNNLTMRTHVGGNPKWPRHPDAVYMIEARFGRASFVKIGRSASVAARADTLQHESPLTISVIHHVEVGYGDSFRLERFLHHRFSARRVRGEWFRLAPAHVAWFKAQTRETLIAAMRAEMPREWLVKHDRLFQLGPLAERRYGHMLD